MKAIIIIISFLLEGIVSNFVPINGFLAPLFTLVALIIIYPLFDETAEYYKYAFVTGLVYDLFYTDTILFHAIILCFMAFIITRLNLVLSDNYLNILVIMGICILIYRVVTYSLLVLVSTMAFDFMALIISVLKSLIINLIYSALLFFVVKKCQRKYKYKF
ncbi:rod shape-determining protein MreD [Firmicutes bacterium CAG:822]|nr:rod shape-determining protein MreD [Firmicutes bacterium CAG:822]